LRSFHQQKNEILENVSEIARRSGFGLQATPVGIVPIPIKNGQPMSEEEFLRLTENERETLKELQQEVREEVEAAMRQLKALDNSAREVLEKLDQQVVRFVLDLSIAALKEKYPQLPDVLAHLNAICTYILENVSQFKPEPDEKA